MPTAPPPSGPKSSSDRLVVAVALVVAIVAVAGVGWWVLRDDGGRTSTDVAVDDRASDAAAAAEDRPDADDLLLTFADVPDGWVREYDEEDDGGATDLIEAEDDDPDCFAATDDELGPLAGEPEDEAEISFSNGDSPPFLSHSVARVASAADADRYIGLIDETFRGCPSWQAVEDGETVTYTLTPLLLAGIEGADRAGAFTIELATPSFTVTNGLVLAQVDEYLVLVMLSDLGAVSNEQLLEFTNAALAKF